MINNNLDKDIILTVNRNNKELNIHMHPVLSDDSSYKLGIWIRDDMQGIGTMTYIDEKNNYAVLGHGISDIDTGELLDSTDGKIYRARIWGVKKGKDGVPGGLCGTIDYKDENVIGTIEKNTNYGIFGKTNIQCKKSDNQLLDIAFKQEVELGKAQIQMMENNEIKSYDVEIEKISLSQRDKDKNMIIRITDSDLLKKTHGIVQGMSGSPLIQNGKVIGAVTHVFVNDSKRGYAIFAERMIEESNTKSR